MKKIIIKFVSVLIVAVAAPIFVIGLLNSNSNKEYLPSDFIANADTPIDIPPSVACGSCEGTGCCN